MTDADVQAEEREPSQCALVVMGVCGAGKTEIGRRLAEALRWTFVDADDFHPPANIEKMRAATPLTDADRWPWLDALATVLQNATAGRGNVVLACSALARRYRDRLGLPHPRIRLVHLDDAGGVIRQRMRQRADHFMPAALLDSQLAILERPAADERPIVVDVASEPETIVRAIVARLTDSTCSSFSPTTNLPLHPGKGSGHEGASGVTPARTVPQAREMPSAGPGG